MQGPSPVAASGGHSSSRCTGLSPSRPLLLRSTGSRRAGSVVVAHGPSCSTAHGILPDQGLNPCPLHWQADSQPLRHQGSPALSFFEEEEEGDCVPILLVVWPEASNIKVCRLLGRAGSWCGDEDLRETSLQWIFQWIFWGSLLVQWFGLRAPSSGASAWPPACEPRSHKLHGVTTTTKNILEFLMLKKKASCPCPNVPMSQYPNHRTRHSNLTIYHVASNQMSPQSVLKEMSWLKKPKTPGTYDITLDSVNNRVIMVITYIWGEFFRELKTFYN